MWFERNVPQRQEEAPSLVGKECECAPAPAPGSSVGTCELRAHWAAWTAPHALHACVFPPLGTSFHSLMCSLKADVDCGWEAFYTVPWQKPGDSSPETLETGPLESVDR